jgi:multiple sugar transport system permease protein
VRSPPARRAKTVPMRATPAGVGTEPSAPGRRRGLQREMTRLGWVLVAPVAVLMVVFVLYPLILGANMSTHVTDFTGTGAQRFVGLRNYTSVLTSSDTKAAVLHTAGYWIVSVGVELAIGLAAALALNRPFRGRGIVLALLILPWALPGVVAGLLWSRILDPSTGLLNSVLLQLHIIHSYKLWFSSPLWSVALIGVVQAWTVAPLTTLILLGGLQGIPKALYESAVVDGASAVASFRWITLPLLGPTVAVALTVGAVVAFGIFDVIYVLNGTAFESRSLMMQVYLTTFQDLNFGKGVALAFVITAITGLVVGLYLLAFRRSTK